MSGAAMLPSIWPGEFLLASRIRVKEIHRGDVVALRCPAQKDRLCLKRVVAIGGDRVEFHDGILFINTQRASYHPAGPFQTESVTGVSWAIWPEKEKSKDSEAVVVPPQTVYLLNDKRADHDDSRTWGPVQDDLLEARVFRIWMSLDWFDGERVRTWPRVRWGRLLRGID
jgi:signal peptidase I